jgi:hypothetical protein
MLLVFFGKRCVGSLRFHHHTCFVKIKDSIAGTTRVYPIKVGVACQTLVEALVEPRTTAIGCSTVHTRVEIIVGIKRTELHSVREVVVGTSWINVLHCIGSVATVSVFNTQTSHIIMSRVIERCGNQLRGRQVSYGSMSCVP